ncbi:MAG: FHA domain-containing protein, partial [Actinomycetes bacterium]
MTSGGTDAGAVDHGSDGPSDLGGLLSQLRRGLRADPPPTPAPPPEARTDPRPDPAPGPVRPFPPQVRSAVRRLLESAGLATADERVAMVAVDLAGRHHPVGPGGLVIGRAHASGAAIDISVDHPAVSRRHAVVTLEREIAVVTDAGSTNGTSV